MDRGEEPGSEGTEKGAPRREPARIEGAPPESAGSKARSLAGWLTARLPWAGTPPFRAFVLVGLAIGAGILAVKIALDAPLRLQLYVAEVLVIFFLGFVVLEGRRARALESRADRIDAALAVAGVVGLAAWNLGLGKAVGVITSAEPGFGDAIALILVTFVALYGRKNVRPMIAPISLLVVLAGITVFISDEHPAFYAWIGQHFVSLTVWMSASILQLQGYQVATGPDFFRILGTPTLRVEVGIRCGGLDVATVYSILIAYFAWRTNLGLPWKIGIAAGAAIGALVLNGLRVVLLTSLFLTYPADLVEAFHTNLGDLLFLAYAAPFIVGLQRIRA